MPDEVKNNRNSAAQNKRGGEHISEERNAQKKNSHPGCGENDSANVSANWYISGVNFRG
jgi:hypothetical protein